jgi:hypothetical protein
MNEGELLERIARTLKQEIGPAVDVEYPKTQAFMAAVVLQKLGQQIDLAARHQAAERADLDALLAELPPLLGTATVPALNAALAKLTQARDKAALCELIEALYANRSVLGAERFAQVLGRVRQNLRASIDRQMEYAA